MKKLNNEENLFWMHNPFPTNSRCVDSKTVKGNCLKQLFKLSGLITKVSSLWTSLAKLIGGFGTKDTESFSHDIYK